MEADRLSLASQEQLWGDEESCYSGAHRSSGRHSGTITAISMTVAIARQVGVLRKKRGTDLK
jgi:hypothetical protein